MLGNNLEPGITASVESAPTVTTSNNSPGTPLIVGGGDIESNEANAEEIHAVGRAPTARRLFGSDSRLTDAIVGALNNDAMPVLAVAPDTSQRSKDIGSLSSETGTLDHEVKEDISEVSVTVDSNTKDVRFVYKDVADITVESGKAVINPATRKFKLDETPTDTGSIEYTSLDYSGALDKVEKYEGNVDFVTGLKENERTVGHVLDAAEALTNKYNPALAIGSIPPNTDPSNYTSNFDTSRLQLVVPPRVEGGASTLGAYIGMRANIGITTTPINQRVELSDRLIRTLDEIQRGDFIDKNVTPMEAIGTQARVADDLTTVTDQNDDESNLQYSFSRIVLDYLIANAHDVEEPFVGDFNSGASLGTLRKLLNKAARPLENSNVIHSLDVNVELIDPTQVRVTLQADVAEPIRFIDNDFVVGN